MWHAARDSHCKSLHDNVCYLRAYKVKVATYLYYGLPIYKIHP